MRFLNLGSADLLVGGEPLGHLRVDEHAGAGDVEADAVAVLEQEALIDLGEVRDLAGSSLSISSSCFACGTPTSSIIMTLNFGVVRVARSAAMLDSVAPSMVKTRHRAPFRIPDHVLLDDLAQGGVVDADMKPLLLRPCPRDDGREKRRSAATLNAVLRLTDMFSPSVVASVVYFVTSPQPGAGRLDALEVMSNT